MLQKFQQEEKTAENPYVAQYFIEKSSNPNHSGLVDPVEEDRIAIDALTSYYQSDVKVADILSRYVSDDNLLEKATSLNKEDKIYVLHKIVEVYPSVTDPGDQKELVEFAERYVRNVKDSVSATFLKDIEAN